MIKPIYRLVLKSFPRRTMIHKKPIPRKTSITDNKEKVLKNF